MLRPDGAGICLFLSSSAIGKTFATLGRRKVKAGGGWKQIYGFGDQCMGKISGNFFHCPGGSLALIVRGENSGGILSPYICRFLADRQDPEGKEQSDAVRAPNECK